MRSREEQLMIELCEKIQEKLVLDHEEALIFVERAVLDKVEFCTQEEENDELEELNFDKTPKPSMRW